MKSKFAFKSSELFRTVGVSTFAVLLVLSLQSSFTVKKDYYVPSGQSVEGMIGEVQLFAGNFAPRGWALCEGQLLAISQHQALFSVLGTTYGGDGRTTFGLPDLRGRAAVSPGTGPGLSNIRLGEKGGMETITLTRQNMPNHKHGIRDDDGVLESMYYCIKPDKVKADPNGNISVMSIDPDKKTKVGGAGRIQTTNSGNNDPFNSRNPYLGINYIICLQGVYPSRN